MAAVQRRPEPRKFLDASLVPLERALRARADVLAEQCQAVDDAPDAEGPTLIMATVLAGVAQEFRVLADELHHW